MRTPIICSLAVGLALLSGCGTSDYSRITDKIAAYEAQAATTRAEMAAGKQPEQRIRGYSTLISLTRKELEIARRINPETNPAYRSKAMTLEQARQDKTTRVAKLEQQLADLSKARDAEIAAQAGAATAEPSK